MHAPIGAMGRWLNANQAPSRTHAHHVQQPRSNRPAHRLLAAAIKFRDFANGQQCFGLRATVMLWHCRHPPDQMASSHRRLPCGLPSLLVAQAGAQAKGRPHRRVPNLQDQILVRGSATCRNMCRHIVVRSKCHDLILCIRSIPRRILHMPARAKLWLPERFQKAVGYRCTLSFPMPRTGRAALVTLHWNSGCGQIFVADDGETTLVSHKTTQGGISTPLFLHERNLARPHTSERWPPHQKTLSDAGRLAWPHKRSLAVAPKQPATCRISNYEVASGA